MSSVREVAKKANVSTATVSRSFTTPDLINSQTRKRVLDAAHLLGYSPRRQTALEPVVEPRRKLGSRRSETICFEFFAADESEALATNTFYAPVLLGAEKEASALGMHFLLHSVIGQDATRELPKLVVERRISGMLLVGTADPEILTAMARYVPALIVVDGHDKTDTVESVLSDGFGGAYTATEYLLQLGHRERIRFLMRGTKAPTFLDRQRGYLSALFKAGLTVDASFSVALAEDEETRLAEITRILESSDRPTAVLCCNDDMANQVLRVCWKLGLHVPDDLSVVGFDDIEHSRHSCPPLTTVRVDKEMMGRLAVRRLHARLSSDTKNREPEIAIQNTIPVQLIVRDSCKPI